MRRDLCAVLAGVVLAGCGDSIGPLNAPSQVRAEIGQADLRPGMETSVSLFGDDRLLSSADVVWETRDPSVVAVTRGTVRAIGAGTTYLVGTYADRSDSVAVLVHFSALGSGGAALRVPTLTPVDGTRLTGVAASAHLVTEDRYYTTIIASNKGGGPTREGFTVYGDSMLSINFIGRIAVGTQYLEPPPSTSPISFAGPGVRLLMPSPDKQLAVYVPVRRALLQITALTYPAAPGYRAGSVSGYVSFEAAGFTYTLDSVPKYTPIGNRTVMIFAEFTSPLYEYPLMESAVALDGTPFVGRGGMAGPAVFDAQGRLGFKLGGVLTPTDPTLRGFDATVSIARATPGTLTVTPSGGDVSAQLTIRPLSAGTTPLVATQSSGTVTVTSYTPATDDTYGEIRGELNITFAYGSQAGVSGYVSRISSAFRIPVAPLTEPPPVIRP